MEESAGCLTLALILDSLDSIEPWCVWVPFSSGQTYTENATQLSTLLLIHDTRVVELVEKHVPPQQILNTFKRNPQQKKEPQHVYILLSHYIRYTTFTFFHHTGYFTS